MSQAQYAEAWRYDAYRSMAPGTLFTGKFIEIAQPRKGQTVRDLGCGTGRAGAALACYGLDVTLYDWVEHCRDTEVVLPFVLHDLREPIPGPPADFVFNTDMMEHVAPEDVDRVLTNVLAAGQRVFLNICCLPDLAGEKLGLGPLHLTVENHDWWRARLEALDAHVLWSEDCGDYALFFVSAYADGRFFVERSGINVTEDEIRENIRANLAAGYQELRPHLRQDMEIMVLAGGPSLADFEEEIREKRATGMRLVTVNGTYNWCLERGITPSIQIVCDGREFNRRFVDPTVERVRYLIASQCHPAVAASLAREQVVLWHSGDSYSVQDEAGLVKYRDWFPIQGGGTVMLRAFPLLVTLGFRQLHLYGFDSCLRSAAHHAYVQPENDDALEIAVMVGGRTFTCHPWMVAQAQDFQHLVRVMGDAVELAVHGDGLIAHMLQTAATDLQTL